MRRPFQRLIGVTLAVVSFGASGGLSTSAGAAEVGSSAGELWVSRYNGPGNGVDEAKAIAVSPNGSRVFVTGLSTASGQDYATAAYDGATGAPLWTRRYNGTGNGNDEAFSIAVSPDGSKVVVTGESLGTTSGYDYATIVYDAASGAPLWLKRYNGLGNLDDIGRSVGVSSSRVYVTGNSDGGSIGYDYATVAYDLASGVALWERRYDGTDHGSDYAYSLAVAPNDRRVYVTGYADMGATGLDYVTQAIDAVTGVGIWGTAYNGSANSSDYGYAVAVSPDGTKVFATGKSTETGTDHDYSTVAFNASTGAKLWFRRYDGPTNGHDEAASLVVSPGSNRVFVTGYSYGGSSNDYATIAYDAATGAQIWARRYNGLSNGSDLAYDVAVTPDGVYAYVTGYAASGASGDDYATVAYLAATGGVVGVRRYNGPGNATDHANAVTTSATIAYVTGESSGVGTTYDYGTAAYQI